VDDGDFKMYFLYLLFVTAFFFLLYAVLEFFMKKL